MVSERSTGSTSLLLLYSFATSAIVFLITFTYSLSDKNEVFSFQKPGPLGLLLFARWSVMREWSVLYLAKISAFMTAGFKLVLVKKKAMRHCISGFFLLQVNHKGSFSLVQWTSCKKKMENFFILSHRKVSRLFKLLERPLTFRKQITNSSIGVEVLISRWWINKGA